MFPVTLRQFENENFKNIKNDINKNIIAKKYYLTLKSSQMQTCKNTFNW